MVASVAHPRLDETEFLALQAAAGWRMAVELIDGEAVVMPPSGGHASSAQGELYFALRSWQAAVADDGLLLQDVFVRLGGGRYLAPDIAWWQAARRPELLGGAVDVVPDLVVEVLSPATRANDIGVKRIQYMQSGVRELWLADPDAAAVSVVRGDHDVTLSRDRRLESSLLSGFGVDLAQVFLSR
jgi:Uma2 family endonuclease